MAKEAKPAFQPIKLDSLPRRNPGSAVDLEAANALLAIVQEMPAEVGATDGVEYASGSKARSAGLRAMRLLSHVAPAGSKPTIRTGPVGKGFMFAVTLKTEAEAEAEATGEEAAK
jgi:hypothetical protein